MKAASLLIHRRHSVDGYPLCWPMDRDGEFRGTHRDEDVTCRECRKILAEDMAASA